MCHQGGSGLRILEFQFDLSSENRAAGNNNQMLVIDVTSKAEVRPGLSLIWRMHQPSVVFSFEVHLY